MLSKKAILKSIFWSTIISILLVIVTSYLPSPFQILSDYFEEKNSTETSSQISNKVLLATTMLPSTGGCCDGDPITIIEMHGFPFPTSETRVGGMVGIRTYSLLPGIAANFLFYFTITMIISIRRTLRKNKSSSMELKKL